MRKFLGDFENMTVTLGIGRFGPFVRFGETFVSIPRTEDPMSMTLDRAIELFEEKRKAEAPVFTYKNLPVTKGTGRFGPFINFTEYRRFDVDVFRFAVLLYFVL